MKEIWKPVEGFANGFYDGLYEISNLGRFKQLPRRLNCRGGSRMTKEKIVFGTKSHGYMVIHLKKDRVTLVSSIHILVATAFLPNPDNKPTVNHKDANRSNNILENLEWATSKEQVDHAMRLGRINHQKGIDRPMSKLTEEQVIEIKRLYLKTNTSFRKVAAQFNVSPTTVRAILDRQKWKHVA